MSDFGLTKYKEQLAGEQDRRHQVEGSIQWMAPEVLDESTDVDYMLADVYSFGIILWEVMTRHQPFEGLSYASSYPYVVVSGPADTDTTAICLYALPGLQPQQ